MDDNSKISLSYFPFISLTNSYAVSFLRACRDFQAFKIFDFINKNKNITHDYQLKAIEYIMDCQDLLDKCATLWEVEVLGKLKFISKENIINIISELLKQVFQLIDNPKFCFSKADTNYPNQYNKKIYKDRVIIYNQLTSFISQLVNSIMLVQRTNQSRNANQQSTYNIPNSITPATSTKIFNINDLIDDGEEELILSKIQKNQQRKLEQTQALFQGNQSQFYGGNQSQAVMGNASQVSFGNTFQGNFRNTQQLNPQSNNQINQRQTQQGNFLHSNYNPSRQTQGNFGKSMQQGNYGAGNQSNFHNTQGNFQGGNQYNSPNRNQQNISQVFTKSQQMFNQ